MDTELGATRRGPTGRPGSPLIVRPAELVELSERVYRGIFGAGLLVATATALYAVGLVFVQVTTLHRGLATGVCVTLTIALLVAAHHHARVYHALRRRPAIWVPVFGVSLGVAHVVIGPASQVLFPPSLTLIGLLGAVVPKRWVLVAALLVAAGQAAPVFTHELSANHQRALLTAACADVFIPLLFSVLIGSLARYMLDLHRTTTAHSTDEALRTAPVKVPAWSRHEPTPPQPADLQEHPAPARTVLASVTPRQLQVIALAAEGLRHAEIAECLGISTGHVTRLLAQARARLEIATTQELVAWAIHAGILPPADDEPLGSSEPPPHTR